MRPGEAKFQDIPVFKLSPRVWLPTLPSYLLPCPSRLKYRLVVGNFPSFWRSVSGCIYRSALSRRTGTDEPLVAARIGLELRQLWNMFCDGMPQTSAGKAQL